jgi:hypothetical protein
MKEAGKRAAKGSKLPTKTVEIEFSGSQKKGIPIVDSRPGKKHTRAGRKRQEERRGRKPKNTNENIQKEVEYAQDRVPQEARLLPTASQVQSKRAVEQVGVVEDPMLEEEVLFPLIVKVPRTPLLRPSSNSYHPVA